MSTKFNNLVEGLKSLKVENVENLEEEQKRVIEEINFLLKDFLLKIQNLAKNNGLYCFILYSYERFFLPKST